MIRINLIPTKRKKKAKPMPMYLVGAVVAVVLTCGIIFFVNSYMSGNVKDLQRKQAQNKQKLEDLKKKIKEVQDFEATNKKFMDRRNIIQELTANQSLPVRILDEISIRLSEGVWITALSISPNGISLSGIGFTNSDIVNYVQSMKGSALFSDVVLLGTQRQTVSEVEVYSFNMTFKVKTKETKES